MAVSVFLEEEGEQRCVSSSTRAVCGRVDDKFVPIVNNIAMLRFVVACGCLEVEVNW